MKSKSNQINIILNELQPGDPVQTKKPELLLGTLLVMGNASEGRYTCLKKSLGKKGAIENLLRNNTSFRGIHCQIRGLLKSINGTTTAVLERLDGEEFLSGHHRIYAELEEALAKKELLLP